MSGWLIADQAIESDQFDLFDHDTVAEELVDTIRSEPHTTCIGLIGRFGSGKTSITNLAMSKLGNSTRFDPILVSADRHAGVARNRNIVTSIASELEYLEKVPTTDIRRALRPLNSAVTINFPDPTDVPLIRLIKGDYGNIPWRIAGGLVGISFLVLAGAWYFWNELNVVVGLLWVTGSLAAALVVLWSLIGAKLRMLFQAATVQDAVPRAEASDDVERVFARVVELHYTKRKQRKLVIFVDDIDRLDPNDVIDALRSIKSLQAVPKGKEPIFVVPCDESVVERAIAKSSEAPAPAPTQESAAKSFLEKFFNYLSGRPPSTRSGRYAELCHGGNSRGSPYQAALGWKPGSGNSRSHIGRH